MKMLKILLIQLKKKAKPEAERTIEFAQRQIQSEYQLSQISLRSEVGILACELADKIVGEHLQNTELSARVIDRFWTIWKIFLLRRSLNAFIYQKSFSSIFTNFYNYS